MNIKYILGNLMWWKMVQVFYVLNKWSVLFISRFEKNIYFQFYFGKCDLPWGMTAGKI